MNESLTVSDKASGELKLQEYIRRQNLAEKEELERRGYKVNKDGDLEEEGKPMTRRRFLGLSAAGLLPFIIPKSLIKAAEDLTNWPIAHRQETPTTITSQYLVDTILKPKYPNVHVATYVSTPFQYTRETSDAGTIEQDLSRLLLNSDENISIGSTFKVVVALLGFTIAGEVTDELYGTIVNMLVNSNNQSTATVIQAIYDAYKGNPNYANKNPIELFNLLLKEFMVLLKGKYPELGYDCLTRSEFDKTS